MKQNSDGVLSRTPIHVKLWQRGWLKRQYEKQGRTVLAIANLVGCEESNVRHALKRLGIDRRKYTMTRAARRARSLGGKASKPHGRSDHATK